ncbi:hypothetical protein R6G99_08460, partial [Actinotignum timonense]|nr:hypothetical protein [Actinotignum timonense]
ARTAEEIGRAFPGVGIILSGAHSPEGIIGKVSQRPRIVVATPGAEPEAEGGFAAALVLDARYLLGEGLGAETRFIRVLARVAARVRCAAEGGHMLVAGGAPPELLNRIARWELGEYAAELLEQRAELDLPPTATWVGITGASGDVRTYLSMLRAAVQAVRRAGRSVLLVVPTTRAARTLQATLATRVGENPTLMVSEESHEKRYRAFLSVLSGQSRIVVGTRGAAWAPLTDLGLAIIMDDAASTLRDIRAPYLAARDVVLERARRENAAFLTFSPYVSEECAQLLSEHRITLLDGTAAARRAALPNISGPHQWPGGEADHLRLPQPAFPILRRALEDGPVLILVPRSGYIPALCCAYCGERALCTICGGNLAQGTPHDPLQCQRCGVRVHPWRCQHCHNGKLRAIRIGSARTAEEIGRAFPGVGIILSGAHSPE